MENTNRSLRVRTNVGDDKFITVNLSSDYDVLEILSLKINQKGTYRYHTSTYGVIVGRVLANNGFGVPNAKLSLFIPMDGNQDVIENALYPYLSTGGKNSDGVRYNLLPSQQRDDCHQVVGTFPSKRLMLDDNSVLEVFDKYYTYTTRTNESGDYMFFGIPVGSYTLHMDLDISDCGKLSQRPRDLVYKGYTMEQFENPNQFKIDTELSSLSQIFSQDTTVVVKPFWGDEKEGTQIGITREDINVNYKFEPTCVFLGSVVSDSSNEGISKKCVPTNRMGEMKELITGSGTIEIIRKKIDNSVEELQIKGKELINGNGVWCFQIPMNLDYVTTDEYGNIVPTDNPDKGIPTRCEVRFRLSMDDNNQIGELYKRGKVLIPHNPMSSDEVDYEFGSKTKDISFKSLMWNGVYSIKSFIPRFQKSRSVDTPKFTGIKAVNIHGGNNPMPYNNIRIKIPFMFWLTCNIVKVIVRIVQIINILKVGLMSAIGNLGFVKPYSYISNELCPDLEGWYFAPGMMTDGPKRNNRSCKKWQHEAICKTFKDIADGASSTTEIYYYWASSKDPKKKWSDLPLEITLADIQANDKFNIEKLAKPNDNPSGDDYYDMSNWKEASYTTADGTPRDEYSVDEQNSNVTEMTEIRLTDDISYLMQCIEMNLAQEYEVIKFDFFNDWINGTVYLPRWAREVKYRRKRRHGEKYVEEKVKGCINDIKRSKISRRYVQTCSLRYTEGKVQGEIGCNDKNKLRCHQKDGMSYVEVFGKKAGIVQEQTTILGDYVYYMKPCEFRDKGLRIPLFATDIIMLGTLSDCNEYGIPNTFESLISTTYKMPTNMALTNVETESYSYNGSGGPTVAEIKDWNCGVKCDESHYGSDKYPTDFLSSGVTAAIPSYQDIIDNIKNSSGQLDNVVLPYEDIFPITEMSGIEWGYTGPAQAEADNDKLFSPGGHFLGLSCGNAETNIKTCVNLQRACEIGATFSERFEDPIGLKTDDTYGEVNYLYVSPTGLISKDQVVDVTVRSAFATMNQNSLKTVTDSTTNHKRYSFSHLIPDSFDGSLENRIKGVTGYNTFIELDWDNYYDDPEIQKQLSTSDIKYFENHVTYEKGYTVHRAFETKSDDYVLFRLGREPKYLNGQQMPVYLNSFYFYFGLKEGMTALDEFNKQFFASCAKSNLIGNESRFTYEIKKVSNAFIYDVYVTVYDMVGPYEFVLERLENSTESTEGNLSGSDIDTDTFRMRNIPIGRYLLTIVDSNGDSISQEVAVGVKDFVVDYDETTMVSYRQEEDRTNIEEYYGYNSANGGFIKGTFNVSVSGGSAGNNNAKYVVSIRKGEKGVEITYGTPKWDELYDSKSRLLYFWGPDTYHVFISLGTAKYEYDTIVVTDGVRGTAGIFLGVGDETTNSVFGYDSLLGFNRNGNSDLTLDNLKNIDTNNNYALYKCLVNGNSFGESFALPIKYRSVDRVYKDIYAAQAEKFTNLETYEVTNNFVLKSNVPSGYNLDFNNIVVTDDKGRNFYYTAYDTSASIVASTTLTCTYNDGVLTINGGSLADFVGDGQTADTMSKDYRLLIDSNNKEYLIKCTIGENTVKITENQPPMYNGEIVKICHMVKLPVYNYPFTFNAYYLVDMKNEKDYVKVVGTPTCWGGSVYNKNIDNNVFRNKENVTSIEVEVMEHHDNRVVGYPLISQTFMNDLYTGTLEYVEDDNIEGDTKVSIILRGLNENLIKYGHEYYLVDDSVTGSFNKEGFNDTEDIIYHGEKMTVIEENGELIAKKDNVSIGNGITYWVYGKNRQTGENDSTIDFIFTFPNEIKLSQTTILTSPVRLINPYTSSNKQSPIYHWENNGFVQVTVDDTDKYPFLSLAVTVNSTSPTNLEIKRNGLDFWKGSSVTHGNNASISYERLLYGDSSGEVKELKIIASDDDIFNVYLNYTDTLIMTSETYPKTEFSNGDYLNVGNYFLVCAALDENNNVVKHSEYKYGEPLYNLTASQLNGIRNIELRYVYKYMGQEGPAQDPNEGESQKQTWLEGPFTTVGTEVSVIEFIVSTAQKVTVKYYNAETTKASVSIAGTLALVVKDILTEDTIDMDGNTIKTVTYSIKPKEGYVTEDKNAPIKYNWVTFSCTDADGVAYEKSLRVEQSPNIFIPEEDLPPIDTGGTTGNTGTTGSPVPTPTGLTPTPDAPTGLTPIVTGLTPGVTGLTPTPEWDVTP